MLSRRELIRLGLLGSAYTLLPRKIGSSSFGDDPKSPRTTPFVMDLPLPPEPREVARFAVPECAEFIGAKTRFFKIVEEERFVSFHPELPPTAIWGYRDINVPPRTSPFAVGPTFRMRIAEGLGEGAVVRMFNELPEDHRGFGVPHTTTHLHGGHHPARSDGFPENVPGIGFRPVIEQGERYDYCYPMLDSGFLSDVPDKEERPSTLWYHDHLLDFTGPNVYRGLAGFYLVFDELDTGSETTGLRLPSGQFDVPLAIQDKLFARDGSLVFDPMDHDGFLGDKFLVNGAIQPRLRVKRRKYRFRFLNASNARFYRFFLSKENGQTFEFDHIGGAALFEEPIRDIQSFQFGPGDREEAVVDFSRFREGDEVFFENRLEQEDGRGPKEVLPRGTQVLKFIVEEAVPDPSRVPDRLRPRTRTPAADIARAVRREFVFDRRHGAWAINGELVDLERPMVTVALNSFQLWRIVNKSGGWFHPIHIHSELMHVIRFNGRVPPPDLRDGNAEVDTLDLGENDEAEVFLQFKDYRGPFVFHCHNLEHEDMFMMARFDVV